MVAWSLMCNNQWLYFHDLEFFYTIVEKRSHVHHIIFISSECPFHTLGLNVVRKFQVP